MNWRRSRRLFLQLSVIYPCHVSKSFGSTTNLQSIIDLTTAGSTVCFPPGDFTITQPLNITKPLTIDCESKTRIINLKSNSPVIKVMASDVKISGLAIKGYGASSNKRNGITHGDAILVGNGETELSNITIENINSENIADSAISIVGSNRKRDIFVTNVDIRRLLLKGVGSHSNYHAGIYIHGGENISISDCDISEFGQCILTTALTRRLSIENCRLHNTSKQHGIYLSGATEHSTVSNNNIYDVAGTGIKCSSPFTLIQNNTIVRPRVWGINLKANLKEVKVYNNKIMDAGNDGIDSGFERPNRVQEDITISKNEIINSGDNGINFVHDENNCTYRNILISNNRIVSTKSDGIRIKFNNVLNSVTKDITIADNEIVNIKKNAISIGRIESQEGTYTQSDFTITNNTIAIDPCLIKKNAAILAYDLSNSEISDNYLQGYDQTKSPIHTINSSTTIVHKNHFSEDDVC